MVAYRGKDRSKAGAQGHRCERGLCVLLARPRQNQEAVSSCQLAKAQLVLLLGGGLMSQRMDHSSLREERHTQVHVLEVRWLN